MSIASIVTRGFKGGVKYILTRGYGAAAALVINTPASRTLSPMADGRTLNPTPDTRIFSPLYQSRIL